MHINITLPDYDIATENFAEVGTAVWIEANGGTDVTHNFPRCRFRDLGLGDWQSPEGEVFRLEVNAETKEIECSPLTVRILADFGGGDVETDHVWTGAEWLAETRDEAAILADCDDYEDDEGVRITDADQTLVTEW